MTNRFTTKLMANADNSASKGDWSSPVCCCHQLRTASSAFTPCSWRRSISTPQAALSAFRDASYFDSSSDLRQGNRLPRLGDDARIDSPLVPTRQYVAGTLKTVRLVQTSRHDDLDLSRCELSLTLKGTRPT